MKPRRLQSATILSMVTMSVVIRRGMLAGCARSVRGHRSLALSARECQDVCHTLPTMPIYEYRCENGHTFDAIQRMADDPLTTCEVCGAPCQRVLHAPAVHFKGSGFYNTDYG